MDDLEQYVADREKREPGFAALVEAAERRQEFARKMAKQRRDRGITQTQIAAAMSTSPSIVSRLESGSDVRISTLEKYVVALGYELQLSAGRGKRRKPKVRAKRAASPHRRSKKKRVG